MPTDSKYQQYLDELLNLEFTGMKLGLDNVRELLSFLDDPHKQIRCIHIAGSNGKGSVSAMLAAAFISNGYTVGLYTSPHLVDFTERIKIGAEQIEKEYVAAFLERLWPQVQRLNATFFEVTTVLAFKYFADKKVDIAIIETGLGGRLDATNVIESPLAAVVTSISLEHTQFLGDTLELIAAEKAGIFKPDSPAIVNVDESLHSVFKTSANNIGAPLTFVDAAMDVTHIHTPLFGPHQESNIRTVLTTLSKLPFSLDENKTFRGITRTIELTGLLARLQEYNDTVITAKGATLILDVAHNPEAFEKLAEYFISIKVSPIVILGLASDKNRPLIYQSLSRFASSVIGVQAETHRAVSSDLLCEELQSFGLSATSAGTVLNGINKARTEAKSNDTFLLCGSHFVVGEYLREYVEKKFSNW